MNEPRKISPNVPMALRKQVQEADRLIAAQHEPPPGTPDPNQGNPDPAAPPLAIQPFDPNAAPPGDPGAPPPGDPGAPPPNAVAPPAPDSWEHKYKVLQGKYDASERRFGQLQAQLTTAQASISELLAARVNAPAPAAAPAAPLTPEQQLLALGVTPKEINDYGGDLIELVARISGQTNSATNAELKRIADMVTNMNASVAQANANAQEAARTRVYESLDASVPTWREVNEDDNFIAWCREIDVFSGASRLQGLQQAFNSNDAPRVVAIFKAFVDGNTPAPTARTPAVDAATLVAPGTARGGERGTPGAGQPSKRIWSEKEISDFYNRARQRKVPKAEYDKTQLEISQAIAEGRVRPDRNPLHHLNNG